MGQFAEAVPGPADDGAALGIPVSGGNVSFYNQTRSTPSLLGDTRDGLVSAVHGAALKSSPHP